MAVGGMTDGGGLCRICATVLHVIKDVRQQSYQGRRSHYNIKTGWFLAQRPTLHYADNKIHY